MAVVFESFLGCNGAGFGDNAFIWFWRASLCIFSLLGCRFLIFSFFGKEIWIFEGVYFARIKNVIFYKKEETYYINLIKGVRLSEDDDYVRLHSIFNQRRLDIINLKKGTIKFGSCLKVVG